MCLIIWIKSDYIEKDDPVTSKLSISLFSSNINIFAALNCMATFYLPTVCITQRCTRISKTAAKNAKIFRNSPIIQFKCMKTKMQISALVHWMQILSCNQRQFLPRLAIMSHLRCQCNKNEEAPWRGAIKETKEIVSIIIFISFWIELNNIIMFHWVR